MSKKEKKNIADNDLQNTPVENEENVDTAKNDAPAKKGTYKYDEKTKSGVYVDQAEAEAFLESQRKKKVRNRIIVTVVSVILVALVGFIAFNVLLGGNSGLIDFKPDFLTTLDAAAVGESVDVAAGDTLFASSVNSEGQTVELWYSPVDTLLTVKVKEGDTVVNEFRSWPKPTQGMADPENPEKYTAQVQKLISSLVTIKYSTSNLDGGKYAGINQEEHVEEINKINNGFRIKYTVEWLDIESNKDDKAKAGKTLTPVSFVVEFSLDNSGNLVVNVPRKEICEPLLNERVEKNDDEMEKAPRLASITVLPFFDAAKQGDKGYFVTPDGAGALTYFNVSRINNYNEYSKRIYGSDDTFDSTNVSTPNLANEYIMIPAFGVVKDNSMVVGFIEEGEAHSSVSIGIPGVRGLDCYYINFVYNFREYYSAKQGNGGKQYSFLEVESSVGDYRVKYSFNAKADGEYNYTDVALKTRENLVSKWNSDAAVYPYLKDYLNTGVSEDATADVLHVKLFMGAINESSVSMFSELKVMTTFNDVKGIISSLKNDGKENIRYSLLGWQNDGYLGNNTKKFSIEKDLGGKSDLKALNEWAASEKVDLAADNNLLIVYGKPKLGISMRSSIVKTPGYEYLKYRIVSNSGTYVADTEFYYMSPLFYNAKMLEKDIEGLDKLGFNGVALQQVGNLLYTDYNKENPLLRQQAVEYYRKWIAEYRAKIGETSVYYGFDYAASVADKIYDIPTESSRLFQVDQTVPFIQIVYHGLVDYYSEPVNRTAQNEVAVLKAIEYGANITFEITENLTEELKYTKYNSLFKSCFTDLKSEIENIYDIAEKTVGTVADASIVAHYCVDGETSGNVYCTEYSNGVKVYVNYGDAEYSVEGVGAVPALGVGVSNASGYNAVASLK